MKALLAALVLLSATLTNAQELDSKYKDYRWQSGPIENRMMSTRTVATHRVSVGKNLGGFRIHFGKTKLGKGIAIQVSTPRDRQRLILTDETLAMYKNSTPYLNGDVAYIEVLARPGASSSGVSIVALEGLLAKEQSMQESICGANDDRQASQGKPFARMVQSGTSSGGCTGTLISESCMVSAGHCTGVLNIAQFNVPLSNENGSANHPPAEDQYPLEKIYAHKDGGVGRDWAVFRVTKNPVTGKTAGSVQGAVKVFTGELRKGDVVRITGYGVDQGAANVTQQSHFGPVAEVDGSAISHQADTMPGNSGSTIIHEDSGEIVGIHTHGGCSSGGGANAGTLLAAIPEFKDAIQKCLADERAERRADGGR